jgi:hypothetical protein
MTAFDYVMSNGGAGYDGAGPSSQQQPQQQEQQQEQELEQQQHHQHQPHPPSSAAGTSYASSVEVRVLHTCHCAWLSAAAAYTITSILGHLQAAAVCCLPLGSLLTLPGCRVCVVLCCVVLCASG